LKDRPSRAAIAGWVVPGRQQALPCETLGMRSLVSWRTSALSMYTPGQGLSGWDWFWVVLAAILDIGHWGASATQRNQIPGRSASEA
jgi:hypothetical protein